MTVGRLILVVGPSGAGKDSVIGYARQHMAQQNVVFGRRIVTRPADATETPDTMDLAQFEQDERAGLFLTSWRAHDLAYALPLSLAEDVAAGKQVVVNVSRRVIPELRERFPCFVVVVDADEQLRRDRIASRGREAPAALEARLRRRIPTDFHADAIIRNEGSLAEAGEALMSLIGAPDHD
ncbi:phosphonate metabolism protein/1,5-bisphosphokinase (PRPP-forming) PhnN [Gluconobacter sp. Dm-74]|uniref:phosphonate metabolism protein/1,5-bisphosphokinase (PRPP-forming) PhnN n=1 Tax=Gluconobacter sp. Dm-74 TaxID=2799803 RepID=UPI001B8BD558|nr:phosphonate metabolism protein/1,5-bisphosphokinase (PRPP-forming) PhnN [Gluconobacter sp. Dm-74]MBS1091888.1 phosphonate metabolism protein/1,5-bisphosphokinase (PRPP-forming) PhnN [Gluconobacter sp. Dm-74]